MTPQDIQLLVAIPVFILMLLLVKHINRGKKPYDDRNYYQGEGQLFDKKSYRGNVRLAIFACLFALIGSHLDEFGQWLYHQFGSELVIAPGKSEWHARVATVMGIGILIGPIRRIYNIYQARREKDTL